MKDNKYVIGVDLGGTNTVFGAVDKNGNIYGECKLKTREYPAFDQFVAAGCDCIMSVSEIVGEIGNICAIGIGAPNGNCYSLVVKRFGLALTRMGRHQHSFQ